MCRIQSSSAHVFIFQKSHEAQSFADATYKTAFQVQLGYICTPSNQTGLSNWVKMSMWRAHATPKILLCSLVKRVLLFLHKLNLLAISQRNLKAEWAVMIKDVVALLQNPWFIDFVHKKHKQYTIQVCLHYIQPAYIMVTVSPSKDKTGLWHQCIFFNVKIHNLKFS